MVAIRIQRLATVLVLSCLVTNAFIWNEKARRIQLLGIHVNGPPSVTTLHLFGGSSGGRGRIPKSPADRDNQAISSIKAAIAKPRTKTFPLIECEFPPLASLNKLGDGSMRSANEADLANLLFCSKLVKSISPIPALGPKIWLLTSSGVTNSYLSKAENAMRGTGVTVASLRNGQIPDGLIAKGDIVVFVSPNGRGDYRVASDLAKSGVAKAVILVNGLAKDQDSVSGDATMAYYLKPLTYNSQVVGYLIRSYPNNWTVFDAVTKEQLGSFADTEILFGTTNTPDLRSPGRLVQKSTDDRAIAARQRG